MFRSFTKPLLFILIMISWLVWVNRLLPGYVAFNALTVTSLLIFLAFFLGRFESTRQWNTLLFGGIVLLVSVFIHVKFLLWVGLCLGLISFAECLFGMKFSLLWVLVFLTSPLFGYFNTLISFPLRLKLAQFTGSFYQSFGLDVEVMGSRIVKNGKIFFVDPACAGLNMLGLTLVLVVFLVIFFSSRTQKQLPIWSIVALFIVAIGLNLLANLNRIAMLIWFEYKPSSVYHDIVGLSCLIIFVLVPAYFLVMYGVKQFGKVQQEGKLDSSWVMTALLLLGCVFQHELIVNTVTETQQSMKSVTVLGSERLELSPEIAKFTSNEELTYVKTIKSFYGIEHNPMVCWQGSGYELGKVSLEENYRSAYLIDRNDTLYTAWWFQNAEDFTTSYWDWRPKVLNGAPPYFLINVTTDRKELLDHHVQSLQESRLNWE